MTRERFAFSGPAILSGEAELSCNMTRRRTGFSLVELIMVMGIIAVLAAIAAPRYSRSVMRYRADMAARRVADDLVFAGTQARQIGKPVVVTFETSKSRYTLAGVAGVVQKSNDYSIDLSADPYRAGVASAAFGSSGNQVTFSMYGQPLNGGQVVVRCGAESRTITLDADSGRTKIQ